MACSQYNIIFGYKTLEPILAKAGKCPLRIIAKTEFELQNSYNNIVKKMPHYPDEIEYSDKYMDDYYEYRHVILPKDVYKKLPRGRLLTESVMIVLCRNGDPLECSNLEAGSTTSFIDQSPISCSSGELRDLTHRPDFLLRALSRLQMLSLCDPMMLIHSYLLFFSCLLHLLNFDVS